MPKQSSFIYLLWESVHILTPFMYRDFEFLITEFTQTNIKSQIYIHEFNVIIFLP